MPSFNVTATIVTIVAVAAIAKKKNNIQAIWDSLIAAIATIAEIEFFLFSFYLNDCAIAVSRYDRCSSSCSLDYI